MLQVHFCFSFFFFCFQYGQSNINNSQNIWLGLTLAVLFLPHWFIPRVFKYRCPSNTSYSDISNFKIMLISFGWYKIYIYHLWVKNTKPTNLSVFKQDQATNNGPKNYFKYVKSEIEFRKSI